MKRLVKVGEAAAQLEYQHLGLRQQLVETSSVVSTREKIERARIQAEEQLVGLQVLLEDTYPDPQCRVEAATRSLRTLIERIYPDEERPAHASKLQQLAVVAAAETLPAIIRATEQDSNEALAMLMPIYEAAWASVSEPQLEVMHSVLARRMATLPEPQRGYYYVAGQSWYPSQIEALVDHLVDEIVQAFDPTSLRLDLARADAEKALDVLARLGEAALALESEARAACARHDLLVTTEAIAHDLSQAVTALIGGDEGAGRSARANVAHRLDLLESLREASGDEPKRVTTLLTAIRAVIDLLPE